MNQSMSTNEINMDGVFLLARISPAWANNFKISQQRNVWSTPNIEKASNAFDEMKPVYLIFSSTDSYKKNITKNIHGVAQVLEKPNPNGPMATWDRKRDWGRTFAVTWIYKCQDPLPPCPIQLQHSLDMDTIYDRKVIEEILDFCQINCTRIS